MIGKERDPHAFSEPEPFDAVGAEVNPCGVPRERDIGCELVDFVTEGQRLAEPSLKPSSIRSRFDRGRDDKAVIEESLEDRCASARIDCMGGWISRMGGTAFRVGLRQKPGALCRLDPRQSVALKDRRVDIVSFAPV